MADGWRTEARRMSSRMRTRSSWRSRRAAALFRRAHALALTLLLLLLFFVFCCFPECARLPSLVSLQRLRVCIACEHPHSCLQGRVRPPHATDTCPCVVHAASVGLCCRPHVCLCARRPAAAHTQQQTALHHVAALFVGAAYGRCAWCTRSRQTKKPPPLCRRLAHHVTQPPRSMRLPGRAHVAAPCDPSLRHLGHLDARPRVLTPLCAGRVLCRAARRVLGVNVARACIQGAGRRRRHSQRERARTRAQSTHRSRTTTGA